jgi:hypothetical protein
MKIHELLKRTFIAVILLLSFYACKKEEVASNPIYGEWLHFYPWASTSTLKFRKDGKFESIVSVIDPTTKEIKGYLVRATGTFTLKSDSLYLQYTDQYSSVEPKPSVIELTHYSSQQKATYYTEFSENNTKLKLSYKCPDGASCNGVSNLTYTRIK